MEAYRDLILFVVVEAGLNANQAMLLAGSVYVVPLVAAATARTLRGSIARAILGGMAIPAISLLFGILAKNPGLLVFAIIDSSIFAIMTGVVVHVVRRIAWWRKRKPTSEITDRQAGRWRSAK